MAQSAWRKAHGAKRNQYLDTSTEQEGITIEDRRLKIEKELEERSGRYAPCALHFAVTYLRKSAVSVISPNLACFAARPVEY